MFCYKCGKQLPEGGNFCTKCGTKVVTDVDSYTEELNTKTMKGIDLFVTFKVDSSSNSPEINDQELDVNVDGLKVGKLPFGKTKVYKIALGQHHIMLGSTHIWIDTPEGSGPVYLTIQAIVQEKGVFKYQLICKPSHLVIPNPQNSSVEFGDLVKGCNNYSQEQYQGAEPEITVRHRCDENVECPNCHSSNLMLLPETKTDISGGGYRVGKGCCGWILLGPLGLLCGLCGTGIKSKSQTVTFWVCKDCGNKFRSPKDIEAEKLSKNVNTCFSVLKGAGIVYIVGNLLNDYNLKVIGIPNWIYIMLGALGISLGALWILGLAFEKFRNDIAYMDDADKKSYFHNNFLVGAVGGGIIFLVTFIGGILSASAEIRFFWIPAWIYILVGVLGMIISVIVMIFSWRMGLNDEESEKFDAKYGSLVEKIVRKMKKK